MAAVDPAGEAAPPRGGAVAYSGAIHWEYSPELDRDPDPGEIVWSWVAFEEDDSIGKDRPIAVIGRADDRRLVAVMLSSRGHDGDRDWIAIGGSPTFSGNVLRYGLGTSYQLNPCDPCRPLSLVTEFVGWTVLEGRTAITTIPGGTIFPDAAGDTIVNGKVGLRWRFSPVADLYGGYGRALTDQTWYDDVFRLELRRTF